MYVAKFAVSVSWIKIDEKSIKIQINAISYYIKESIGQVKKENLTLEIGQSYRLAVQIRKLMHNLEV